ncbi:MAG TPA: DUF11 domain-containing protein [Verrucomicrobiae bacterium]|nr:DUF11 domain-containing protein [Verrucomicrobiae bacterium]
MPILAAGLILAGLKADAQNFILSVTDAPNAILIGSSTTYTISLTNLVGSLPDDVLVTNQFSVPVQFLSYSPNGVSVTTNGNTATFDVGPLNFEEAVQLELTVQPAVTGFITNTVTVTSIDVTNTAVTNVVVQVTNAVTLADLGVTMTGPVQAVITNDWMTYGVSVTNAGPDAAPSVELTNTLPGGVTFEGVSPNLAYTTVSSNLIFSLGTLAGSGVTNLLFTVAPTNAGTLTFSASVGAAGTSDTNSANNSASTNITVIDYLSGTLTAVTNSAQKIDLQNGLTEQSILLSNTGTNDVPAARVVVLGLTNRLFNAVGTNNGNPFVYYSAPLPAGQSVSLLLQYSPRGFFPFTNGQLQAFPVPLPNWSAPALGGSSTNLLSIALTNGNVLIEWPAVTNKTYTVVYSDDVLFSNAVIAPPSIVAPANEVQWIDYGPPTTTNTPANSSARYYRVFMNP